MAHYRVKWDQPLPPLHHMKAQPASPQRNRGVQIRCHVKDEPASPPRQARQGREGGGAHREGARAPPPLARCPRRLLLLVSEHCHVEGEGMRAGECCLN